MPAVFLGDFVGAGDLFLVIAPRESVVASEPLPAFEAPHLDDAAQVRVGRHEKVDVVEPFARQVLVVFPDVALGGVAVHFAQFFSAFA